MDTILNWIGEKWLGAKYVVDGVAWFLEKVNGMAGNTSKAAPMSKSLGSV